MSALVEIRDLSVSFRSSRGVVQALRGVNVDIGRGRIVGVVGESGSGKSTLALALPRLLPPNAMLAGGTIRFDGTDVGAIDPARLRGERIGFVFQDPMTSLNPLFTIGTHMVDVLKRRFPGRPDQTHRERAVELLGRVGIADAGRRLTQYPHEFSGGMRQRVMIAMALSVEPDLLIADEPTTALDVTIESQVVELLKQLRANFDGSILFISHSLGLVAELCDEVVVMYAGTVVESGPVEAVFQRPAHPYTAALLACETEEPGAGRRLRAIAGEVPDLVAPPPGCVFAGRCARVADGCRAAIPPPRPGADGRVTACFLS